MTWHLFEDEPTTCGRFCYQCGDFSDWDSFHRLKHGRNGRMSICKPCKSQQRALTRHLRTLHAPPTACEACGATDRPLQLDHDHETQAFRAYLCCNCNLAARRWGWARSSAVI